MKKFNLGCILAILALMVFVLPAWAESPDTNRANTWSKKQYFNQGVDVKGVFQLTDRTGRTIYFKIDEDGDMFQYNSDGTVNYFYNPSNRVVVINDMDQLSTWAGNNVDTAMSGSSYYQMEAGKTYIVDAVALKLDNPTQSYATSGGVTLHMPLASSTNDLQDVSVLYAQRDSGTSATPVAFNVYVFPAPLAGTTTWYVGATGGKTVGRQNMTGMATSGSSTITTASEGPMATMNTVGEMATWILMYDSAVSAVMKAWLGNMP